jgi:hypothetical protein
LTIDGTPVSAGSMTIGSSSLCTSVTYADGANPVHLVVNVTSDFTSESSQLELSEVVYAGSNSVTVSLVTPSGDPYLQMASVEATLSDDNLVRETRITDQGSVTFVNLPERTIMMYAVGQSDEFEVGSSGIVAEDDDCCRSTTIIMRGFVDVSQVANGDFSNGLQGWVLSTDTNPDNVTIVSHEEDVGPAISRRLRKRRRLQGLDQDVLLTTYGEGEALLSYAFQTDGNSLLRVRYRFTTTEIPEGFFGSEYNDYFRVTIRSKEGKDIITEQNSMNGLGRLAFDDDGVTTWRDRHLLVEGVDTVQVDIAVANVGDEYYDSWVHVDYVLEFPPPPEEPCPQGSPWEVALLQADTFGFRRGGLTKSYAEAKSHTQWLTTELLDLFKQVAAEYDIPIALVAALASKESAMGSDLSRNDAFGIFQLEDANQGLDSPTSLEHMRQAMEKFVDLRIQISDKFPEWAMKDVLRGAVAAYDAGINNVKSYSNIDVWTTGKDYSSDVIARGQWYYLNYNFYG